MLKLSLSFIAGILVTSNLYAAPTNHYTLLQLLGNTKDQFSVCNKIWNNNPDNCTTTGTTQAIYSSPVENGDAMEYFYSIYWSQNMSAPNFDLSCTGVHVNQSTHGAYYLGNGSYMAYVFNYNPATNLITCQTIPQP